MQAGRAIGLAAGIVILLVGAEVGKQLTNVAPLRTTVPLRVQEQTKAPLPASTQFTALPLGFEQNQGQTNTSARYLARGKGYTLLLSPTEANLMSTTRASDPAFVRMRLADANSAATMTAENPLPGKVHYLVGSDPQKWHRNIPTSARVRSRGVYPGIDLVYYGNQGQVEYDFIVAPGADPNRIALQFEGVKSITKDPTGNLLLKLPGGSILVQRKPVIYQETANGRKEIAGGYRFEGKNRVRFTLAEYDRDRPLVIDPVLQYSTFWGGDPVNFTGQGGEDFDQSGQIAADSGGSIYLTGVTVTGIPQQTNPVPVTRNLRIAPPVQQPDREMYITRFTPDGRQVVYSVIIGGEGIDRPVDVAVRGGEASVLMATTSRNLPTVNPLRGASNNTTRYYVFRLNRDGNGLLYGSFLTGRNDDIFEVRGGIAVHKFGGMVITGGTDEKDFPTTRSGVQSRKQKNRDIFVCLLAPNASPAEQLRYSTFVGGDGTDQANDLFLQEDTVHITGSTTSTDIKARSGQFGFGAQSFQIFQEKNGGGTDAFVLCMNVVKSNRDSLAYFTYLGGGGTDIGNAITVNKQGEAYVTGLTGSFDFPKLSPVDAINQVNEAFVIQLNLTGSFPIFSTFLGGDDRDSGEDIALDSAGNIWVVGTTNSLQPGSLVGPDAPQRAKAGGRDGFIVQLSFAGQRVLFGTYLGGLRDETALRMAINDTPNRVFVTGQTTSQNFPVSADAIRKTNPSRDSFVTIVGGLDACATRFNTARITRSGISRNVQTGEDHITLTVQAGANVAQLSKPVRVILFGLPQGVTLVNRSGNTSCLTPAGTPFIDIPIGGDNLLTRNEVVNVTLRFRNPNNTQIPFTAQLVAGPGAL